MPLIALSEFIEAHDTDVSVWVWLLSGHRLVTWMYKFTNHETGYCSLIFQVINCLPFKKKTIYLALDWISPTRSTASATRERIDRLNRRRVTNQADSRWTANVFLSIRDRWEVPPKSSVSTASANGNKDNFLAGYLNCSWLRNKRVLLDTFTAHLCCKQPLVSQGRDCVAP